MYVKSMVGAVLASAGGFGLIVVLGPLLESGAGLGVMLIYVAFVALVVALAELAGSAAGAPCMGRHEVAGSRLLARSNRRPRATVR